MEQFGEGEPLVLIHGLATTRAIWSDVTRTLARTRRVVTLDVPGFGDSAPAGPGFEFDVVADRIARGIAARGIRGPIDLLGHSLGAGIALALADARPRAVRRLVLVAPAGLWQLQPRATSVLAQGVDGMLALRRAFAPLTDVGWGRRLLLAFTAADGASIPPSRARAIVDASARATRSTEAFATIAGADLRPLLGRTTAPLGVIWGAADRTVPPRLARVVREARPDAQIQLIERAGHVVMVERPEAFVTALETLLEGLPKYATSSNRERSKLS